MTTSFQPWDPENPLLQELRPCGQPELIAATETRHARIVCREHGFPDTARHHRFEAIETIDRLTVETSVRVYEELTIRKEVLTGAVLITETARREEAEVMVQGGGVIIPDPSRCEADG